MLIFVVGTRPEAIKIGPVVAECKKRGVLHEIWHTGQHQALFQQTGLVPDRHLGFEVTGEVWAAVQGLSRRLRMEIGERKPDIVVVQGDTTSAAAGANAAFTQSVPVYHIEAGVRSGDSENPYPEEQFRMGIDGRATWGACATDANRANIFEGYHAKPITNFPVTGNPGIDALYQMQTPLKPWKRLPQIVVTLHRRESFGGALDGMIAGIQAAAAQWPDLMFFWPRHPNPEVTAALERAGFRDESPSAFRFGGTTSADHPAGNICVAPPSARPAFLWHLSRSQAVVTDSGGVQEEAAALGIPCVVARDVTDRPESVDSNQAIVAGRTSEGIRTALERALSGELSREPSTVFGDGLAATRIVDHFERILSGYPTLGGG
jgi:UDP-N-acetylglucosamine 2-epimerase (non-hydrolysing)